MFHTLLVILILHQVCAFELHNWTQLRHPSSSSDKYDTYGSSDISWTNHLIGINVVSSSTNFHVVFSLSIKHNLNRDFVIRWSRVGCDKLVEGILKKCNLPDEPAVYMAVMKEQHMEVCSLENYFHQTLAYNTVYILIIGAFCCHPSLIII